MAKKPREVWKSRAADIAPRGGGQSDDENAACSRQCGRAGFRCVRCPLGERDRDRGENREREGPYAGTHEASIMPFLLRDSVAITLGRAFGARMVVSPQGIR